MDVAWPASRIASVGAAALGFARRATDEALGRAMNRRLFGAPLAVDAGRVSWSVDGSGSALTSEVPASPRAAASRLLRWPLV